MNNQSNGQISGTVTRTEGPFFQDHQTDNWRSACTALLVIALGPLILIIFIFSFALKIALAILGFRNSGHGRSLIDEIFTFHLISAIFRRPEKCPVYMHVLQTENEAIGVRQIGEFTDGRIFVGDRVRLIGRWKGGSFIMGSGGVNETLGMELNFPDSPWKKIFFVVLFGAVVVWGLIFSVSK